MDAQLSLVTRRRRRAGQALAALALLGVGTAAMAENAQIQVQGVIDVGTCELSAGDVNRVITLPQVSVSDLPATGLITSSKVPFTITATNCSAGLSNVVFAFTGQPDGSDAQRFLNLESAKGVAIELESADGQTIAPGGSSNTRTAAINGTTASLNLVASYWRLGGQQVEPGKVKAVASVQLTYN